LALKLTYPDQASENVSVYKLANLIGIGNEYKPSRTTGQKMYAPFMVSMNCACSLSLPPCRLLVCKAPNEKSMIMFIRGVMRPRWAPSLKLISRGNEAALIIG
jgi:hypothetical protein